MKRIIRFFPALLTFVFCVTFALSAATKVSAQCTPPASGLVAWWKGDGTALDMVSSNAGVLVNVAYSNGVVNQTFSFDPENYSYGTFTGVKIADRPEYALTNSLTIEGWIRPRGDSYVIFFRGDGRPGLDPYAFSMNGNHEFWFSICDASGTGTNIITTLPYNQWVHVAGTLNGTNGQMRIYTNGVLAVQAFTAIRSFGALDNSQSPGVGIGNVNDGLNTFPFIGDVDEIALYNRALSQTEIQSIVAASSAGKCTSVVTMPGCVSPPAGMVAWLAGDGSAADRISGVMGTNINAGFSTGEVVQAFNFNGTNSAVYLPASSALDVGQGAGFTVEAWINPNDIASGRPLFEWNDGTNISGAHFFLIGAGQPYNINPGPGELYANIVDSSGGDHRLSSPGGIVTTNVFQHVALTYDKASGVAVIYYNGTIVGQQTLGSFTPKTYQNLYLGRRPAPSEGAYSFWGLIDEASVYNRALSTNEIIAIYNASSAGKCPSVVSVTNNTAVPAIASFTPSSGTNGSLVTILGTNFSATAASNIVYFGAVKANVLGAGTNVLTVQVPSGATFAPITVTVGGLTAAAKAAFLPKFAGNGSGISATSFSARQNLSTLNGPTSTVIADLDGDGKPDLIVADNYNNSVSIFRNLGTTGALTAAAFASRVDLPATPGAYSPSFLAVADMDGDGRLDIIAAEYGDNLVSVYRNTSTPGSISSNSFAARADFATGTSPYAVVVRDLDGDGRPEIITVNNGAGTVSILRNTGVVGSNSFAAKVDFAVASGCVFVDAGDLNGDGKPDVVAAGDGWVSVLQNAVSSPGSIGTNAFAPRMDYAIPSGGVDVKIADVDGDGAPDLATTAYLSQIFSVLRNTGTVGNLTTNSFAPRIDYPLAGRGHTLAVGDLDGDGKPDLAVDSELADRLSVFRNASTPGSFTNSSLAGPVEFSTGWNAWGVSIGDLDGDGRPDMVLANTYDGNISIYQNQVPFATNAPPPPPVSCTAAPGGIVGWWSGENNSADNTGTNNGALSASGASYAAGKVGTGFRFDGTNGFVQIPDSASLKPASVTLEAWIYLDPSLPTNRGGEQIIFKKNTWSAWFEGYSLLKTTVDNGNGTYSERFEFTVSRTGNQVVIRSQSLAQRGVWYHVAATYDGNKSTLFVNGVAEASATPGFALDYDTTPIFIGTSGTWAPYLSMFGGIIDEPTIYSRALSTNEIAAIYAAGSAGKCSPVITPVNTNLLVNGSFENPPGIYPYQVFSAGNSMPGWTVENGTVEITAGTYWQSAEGAQSLDLNGTFEDIGTIFQDVPTVPGQNYKVRFAYAGNPECGLPTLKTANAYWNGALLTNLSFDITGHTVTNLGWTYYQQVVTATGTSTRLRFQATSPTFCGLTLDDVSVTAAPADVVLVDGNTPGFYNDSLGTVLDGTSAQFPIPFGSGGGDPTFYPAPEPSLAPAAAVLGNWLNNPSALNANWHSVATVPATWNLNDETAIVYQLNGGSNGIASLYGNFDVDNGIYVWVNGVFKFGACAPGLPSPVGQFEYTNVVLGGLLPGTNYVQVLREDNGISTGYQIRLWGSSVATNPTPVTCTPPPSGLVAWLPAEGSANDYTGTNNGALQNGISFAPGKVGQGFYFNNTNQGVRIPASASLDVGAGAGFTLEAWINPAAADITTGCGMFEWNDSNYWGVHFSLEPGQPFNVNPGPGELYANIVDSGGGWHQLSSPGGVVASNVFQHVALTYDRASGVATIFCNGLIVGQQTVGSFALRTGAGYDLYLGRRVAPAGEQPGYLGMMDEPALYNRALTTNEIIAIYNAGSAGKCADILPPVTVTLLNVDFGSGTNNGKVGFAAAGVTTNDFWNFYTRDDGAGGWRTFGSLVNLKNADGSVTAAGLTVNNAPGSWGSSSTDPMYAGYIYPFDGGNVTVTITNLPAGTYDLLPYSPNGNFTLAVGPSNYPARTCIDFAASNAPVWQEGVQYVRFTNVVVSVGQPLVLTVHPGVGDGALISGLQIALSSFTNALPALPVAPTITQQPTNVAVLVGGLATFTVTAEGTAPLAYQWRFNGTNIVGATSAMLTVSNVQFALAGNYSVLVANPGGSVTSSNAALNVLSPPFILSQTPSQVVMLGSAATFVVNAGGTAPLSYFWFRNNVLIPGATNFYYTLNNAQFVDSGKKFSCVVSNAYGIAASTNSSLKVINTIYNDLCSGAVVITNASYTNTQSTANASSYGDPVPDCVDGFGNGVWYSFTAPVSGWLAVDTLGSDFDTGLAIYAGTCGALAQVDCNDDADYFTSELEIPTTAGVTYYFLVGGYNAHAGNLVFHLNHFVPPVFDVQPTNISVVVSSNGTFSAAVSGTQPIGLQWYLNNTPLVDGGRISGVTNTTLNIANVITNDGGNYYLVASNFVGVTTSSVAVLTPVILPPFFLVQPSSQSIPAGSNVTFSAVVDGTPPYSYQWYRYGSPLTDNANITGSTTLSLSISNLTTANAGNYTLLVTNVAGATNSIVAVLTVLTPPSITQNPVGRSVPPGLPTVFNGAANGILGPAYQWQLNGTNIPGATFANYTNLAVGAGDLGFYTFTASNSLGIATSVAAQLTFGPVAAWGKNTNNECLPPPNLSNVVNVAGNLGASFALRADGSVVAWGGGAGTNVPVNATNAVAIFGSGNTAAAVLRADGSVVGWNTTGMPVLSNIVSLAVSNTSGTAVRANGTLVGWGFTPYSTFPTNLNHVTTVSIGYPHGLALRDDGTVVAWGSGAGTNVPVSLANVTAIAAGNFFSLALQSSGKVVAWGSSAFTNIPTGATNITAISINNTSTGFVLCQALRADGNLLCWGSNNFGYGETNPPAALKSLVTSAMSAGAFHGLALVNDGSPQIIQPPIGLTAFTGRDVTLSAKVAGAAPLSYQWLFNGTNLDGATNVSLSLANLQLANAGGYQLFVSNYLGTAISIPAALNVIVSPLTIAGQNTATPTNLYQAGKFTVSGFTVNGSGPLRYQWFFSRTNNGYAAIAGATNDTLVKDPALALDTGNYYVAVSNLTSGLTSAPVNVRVLFARGFGYTAMSNPPVNVTNAVALATGGSSGNPYGHYLALGADGKVTAWANYLQTGIYTETNLSALSNSIVTAIAASASHTLALKSDGTVSVFGGGATNVPNNLNGVTAIACGTYHDLALKSDGTVVGWLDPKQQNFGQATNTVAATNIVAITAGLYHSLGLRADGTVIGWGNTDGSTSIPITTANATIAIAAGNGFGVALRTNGTVVQWGNGIANYPVPSNLSNVVAISASGTHVSALKNNGTVVSWGFDYISLAASNLPPDLTNVVGLASGGEHDIALFGTRAPVFTVQPWNRAVTPLASSVSNITLVGKVAGVQPVSYQWRLNGTNYPGATNDTLVLRYDSQQQPAGTFQLVASNSHGIAISKPAKVTVVIPLAVALDTVNGQGIALYNWLTSGNATWFGQTNYVHFDPTRLNPSAARSGGIGAVQETIMQTTFATNAAGTVSFWWKVSSEQFFDTLEFRVNGTVQASISGEVDWTFASFPVNAGTNVLMWRYSKDGSFDSGLDAAFVDQFAFLSAPIINVQPVGLVANLGQSISLQVVATGTPQLRYQWKQNGSPVGGNSSTLVLNNVARAQGGTYSVIVTNAGGMAVSSNAAVVVKVPQLLGSPTLLPDGSLAFTSTDANGGTLTETDLANFEAQASTNLVNWTTLSGGLSLTNGMLQLNDAARTNFNSRYYRIVEH